jgi:hypothetical protein
LPGVIEKLRLSSVNIVFYSAFLFLTPGMHILIIAGFDYEDWGCFAFDVFWGVVLKGGDL